jgi:hypothetical protein
MLSFGAEILATSLERMEILSVINSKPEIVLALMLAAVTSPAKKALPR